MNGNIPVLFVDGESLAEAWEKSVISVYKNGCDIIFFEITVPVINVWIPQKPAALILNTHLGAVPYGCVNIKFHAISKLKIQ